MLVAPGYRDYLTTGSDHKNSASVLTVSSTSTTKSDDNKKYNSLFKSAIDKVKSTFFSKINSISSSSSSSRSNASVVIEEPEVNRTVSSSSSESEDSSKSELNFFRPIKSFPRTDNSRQILRVPSIRMPSSASSESCLSVSCSVTPIDPSIPRCSAFSVVRDNNVSSIDINDNSKIIPQSAMNSRKRQKINYTIDSNLLPNTRVTRSHKIAKATINNYDNKKTEENSLKSNQNESKRKYNKIESKEILPQSKRSKKEKVSSTIERPIMTISTRSNKKSAPQIKCSKIATERKYNTRLKR